MKKYILGNIKKIIYESNNSPYKVGVFKVNDTNDDDMKEYVGKVIGFTGSFVDINADVEYILYGNLKNHPKYGIQYNVESYEIKEPSDIDSLVLYLSSGMFKGIGLKTAKKIVERFGINTIKIIKEDYEKVALVSGMTITKARNMHDRIVENEYNQELILKLNGYGFSVREAIDLITDYGNKLQKIIDENIYDLVSDVPFNKLDSIFLKNNDEMDKRRVEAIILHTIYNTCYETGDTLLLKDELFIKLKKCFNSIFTSDDYLKYIDNLAVVGKIVLFNEYITLSDIYNTEKSIIMDINRINDTKTKIKDVKIDDYIYQYEKMNNITFNDDQKEAIKGAVLNNFFIITGGPGTGKTTIIKAIVMILKEVLNVNNEDMALLAPTGRASKRINESVGIPAYTIHKFLRWNKETESFILDEYNKAYEKIIIVDESSMIDIFLFSSLLKALRFNVKLILVGDANQLPSIGPGDVLNDLLNISTIKHKYLNTIYRVKEGSYITYLANDIKSRKYFERFPSEYSDFKFIESSDDDILKYLKEIVTKAIDKGISCDNFQVLAPMYKGLNGIDNLNNMMAELFNSTDKKYIIGDKYYRINDKVIQLVNDVDNNVYNGDIGYIKDIYYRDKKLTVLIDYSGNLVEYKSGDFDKFNLAYAVSIHKSQGSEYANVVIILARSFNRMFYNKLIYTAVTRAKSSLIILGSIDSFNKSVSLNYGANRNTYLKYV